LGVSYTYLSKLENNELTPSEEFVHRAARYFKVDRDQMLLSAGKIPPEVLKILQEHPEDAVQLLRAKFGRQK
jgi:transcriptional regulator with XRE-family HTH domain